MMQPAKTNTHASTPASLLPTSTPQISLPSEPLPPVSVMQSSASSAGAPAPIVATAPSASVQVIQVMTSQGLKTFRLTSNKTTSAAAEPMKAETPADQILKLQQPLPIQIPATSAAPSLLRAKLPAEVSKSFSAVTQQHQQQQVQLQHQQQQQQQPQQMTRLITMSQPEQTQSVIKVTSEDIS